MDVSSKEFVVHAVDGRGKTVYEGTVSPDRAGLRRLVKDLGSGAKLLVFEAGNQMKWIALALKKMAEVTAHVVHPNEVKWISQSNGKTDKVDARKLARLTQGNLLPRAVHVVEGLIPRYAGVGQRPEPASRQARGPDEHIARVYETGGSAPPGEVLPAHRLA